MHRGRAVPFGSVLAFALACLLDNSMANPVRTLERAPEELAWRTWLQPQEEKEQPRRPTKSLFVAPANCPPGHSVDRNGCAKVVTVNEGAHENFLLEKLNAQFGSPTDATLDVLYDYDSDDSSAAEDAMGPYQFSLPLGVDESVSDERNENSNDDDKSDSKRTGSRPDLEAELALLKLQTAADEGIKTNVHDNPLYFSLIDKPKRHSDEESLTTETTSTTETTPATTVDEIITYETTYINLRETEETTTESTPITETTTNEITTETDARDTTMIQKHHTLVQQKDEIKPELHGDSLNKALKMIGRYAEVTTDESYMQGSKSKVEQNTLGSRTKPEYYPYAWKLEHQSYESPRRLEPLVQRQYPQYLYRYGEGPRRSPEGVRHLQDYWPSQRRHRHARRRADR